MLSHGNGLSNTQSICGKKNHINSFFNLLFQEFGLISNERFLYSARVVNFPYARLKKKSVLMFCIGHFCL